MTGWSVDILGTAILNDRRDVRCLDPAELARVVGAATTLEQATVIHIRRIPESGETAPVISINDPIETGREAALAQWEARWHLLMHVLAKLPQSVPTSAIMTEMNDIADLIPTGLPVGQRWVARMTGRIDLQLEPERVTDLFACLLKCGVEWHGEDRRAVAELLADLMQQAKDQAMTEDAWPESRSTEGGS